ncbi:NTP transferase domain-containing protein [Polymorphobacter fuscus]|uniref:NTP transferase domain-containing protein n=1 Tax=Sandarakinorhabdus fusca TaxID=1439888 RepID=A0A7C9KKN9_9SPHN|nr:NTP transferase domain-containing protein [Polymorphobacter fuscus]KAB7649019.1 NTP transferase domain-containing protein [Polymorphobacter fuscus]MQT16623.1 NTP transferase domain-containing protein [Polymorphobacter fuscus]NJC07087.1 molybdenum cofactor cytidylyltransferase [Polymorphobacter fuscus]
MIFASTAIDAAVGGILAHSRRLGSARWAKGRILSEADIAAARAAGIAELTIACLAADDVGEDAAATRLAAALAGAGCRALAASHGRVNIAATHAGLCRIDGAMVAAVNAGTEALTLATLAPDTRVAAGEIVATIKVIPYAVGAADLGAALASATPIAVAGFRPLAATLIQTRLPGLSAKMLAKTARVTADRIVALGGTLTEVDRCAHDATALAAALRHAPGDLLLVAGASATVDRGDVIPAAIVRAGGEVERLGMPVDPGNLLCLGSLDGRPVIGLPGCARSPKRNGFDLVIEALAAGLPVTAASIAALGIGGLLPEAERPEPRTGRTGAPRCTGAIVLAAGRSSRMGQDHKLLADWQGRPLVTHVVDAIAAAGLPPPIVVVGTRADAVRAALSGRDAIFVFADDHDLGLAHSLRAGLAAVPPAWDAALVCLGDMPRVDPATLRSLAAAPGDVALPVRDGKRGNPVRWSRRHFAALMALEGDIGGKALIAALPTPPTEITAPDDGIFDDIDTPAALAALRARPSAL